MSRRRGDRVRLEGTAGRSRGMEVCPHCEALAEGGHPQAVSPGGALLHWGQVGPTMSQQGPIQVATSTSEQLCLSSPICPLWTGIWPRTPSSVTVTSSGWQTSCAPTPSRPVVPAVPAPDASPTSALARSKARSSGAQVAAYPPSGCSGTLRCFLGGSNKGDWTSLDPCWRV